MVSAITRRINNHAVDNGDVEIHPSEFPSESNSEYNPDMDTTLIKSIYDYEMDQLLECFHSKHDADLLDVYPQMLQD